MNRFYILLFMLSGAFVLQTQAQKNIPLFIGGYTIDNDNEGIYIYYFNTETGSLNARSKLTYDNPSFLAKNKAQDRVYAVHELEKGRISAYAFEEDSLKLINEMEIDAAGPCHIAIDPEEKFIAVSNYAEGTLSTFLIDEEHKGIGEALQEIRYEGRGIHPERQEGPHIHSAFFDDVRDQVHVQDLGTDKMYVYSIDYSDEEGPRLLLKQVIESQQGGGPRQITFNEDKTVMYALMELSSVIAMYRIIDDQWLRVQYIKVNAPDFKGQVGAAEIRISKDGKFLYASDRLDSNKIFSFNIGENGFLTKAGEWETFGEGPRGFTLSPEGDFLVVANQLTNNVVVFKINKEEGSLSPTDHEINTEAPTVVFF